MMAERRGEPISRDSRPDTLERRQKAVDELWRSPTQVFAVEHTRVDTYKGQSKQAAKIEKLIEPAADLLSRCLDGRFYLGVGGPSIEDARKPGKLLWIEIVNRTGNSRERIS